MNFNRRTFFKVCGAAGAASLAAPSAKAADASSADFASMLVDTTKCVGCRGCEAACSEANGLPAPAQSGQESVFDTRRTTDTNHFTVVNRYATTDEGKPVYAKKQCMHCVEPACASACLVKALDKTPEGAVVYHQDRCIGCRYCMVACSFGIPKFQYESAFPFIRKCIFCYSRQKAGELPACAQVCPSGALTFGKRKDMLELAKSRIYQHPDDYVHHVYGEDEAGGTSWLYIGKTPFEQLDFPTKVGNRPLPELTWPFLAGVPVVLTLWPPFLMGLYQLSGGHDKPEQSDPTHGKENDHAASN
jgi:formate dehydrogenase iron-sulfur subunit